MESQRGKRSQYNCYKELDSRLMSEEQRKQLLKHFKEALPAALNSYFPIDKVVNQNFYD